MAAPFPNASVNGKWIGWTNGSSDAQHAIYGPQMLSDGNLWVLPGPTLGTGVANSIMKIQTSDLTKIAEYQGEATEYPGNHGQELEDGDFFVGQNTVTLKALRYDNTPDMETDTVLPYIAANPCNALGIRTASNKLAYIGKSSTLAIPVLLDYGVTPMTYINGSTMGTWSTASTAYDSDNDWFWGITGNQTITKFNNTMGVIASNNHSLTSMIGIIYFNGYVYAICQSGTVGIIKIDPSDISQSAIRLIHPIFPRALLGPIRLILVLFLEVTIYSDKIDVIDPSDLSVLQTITDETATGMPGAGSGGPLTFQYMRYHAATKRIFIVDTCNKDRNENNIAVVSLTPGGANVKAYLIGS
jgi:hypothetical protein